MTNKIPSITSVNFDRTNPDHLAAKAELERLWAVRNAAQLVWYKWIPYAGMREANEAREALEAATAAVAQFKAETFTH